MWPLKLLITWISFYKRSSPELARNAICPSHYMGVVELYRTTKDPKYLATGYQPHQHSRTG